MQKKIRVGLVFGGRSGEHEVSIASALSVYNALDKSRYDVTLIGIDKEGRWLLPDPKPILAQADNPMLVKLAKTSGAVSLVPFPDAKQIVPVSGNSPEIGGLDVILPILHGTYGEDGTIQGLLELAQIPYAGSGVLGSSVGMDKDVARRLMKAAGIATVPTLAVHKHKFAADPAAMEKQILAEFKFPFFIKPANAGSSVGVHKVKSADQLRPALKDAFDFDLKVLVEKGVNARELECAVLGNEEPKASIVGEIVPRHEFYSYEAKYLDENGAELCIPATNVSSAIVKQIQEWSVLAFKTLECRGLSRVDFFLDRETGELFLNEINTMPGFTKISMYPKLWEATGLSYSALLDELIRLAMDNSKQRKALKTSYDIR
jgi:D-alanine-D-alanine ligase